MTFSSRLPYNGCFWYFDRFVLSWIWYYQNTYDCFQIFQFHVSSKPGNLRLVGLQSWLWDRVSMENFLRKYVEFVLSKLKLQTLLKTSCFNNFYIIKIIETMIHYSLLGKNSYPVENSKLNCNAYPLTGSYMIRVFTKRNSRTDCNTYMVIY